MPSNKQFAVHELTNGGQSIAALFTGKEAAVHQLPRCQREGMEFGISRSLH